MFKRSYIIFILSGLFVVSCKTHQPVATNIPVKTPVDSTKKNIAVKDSIVAPKSKTFHISLLLPLNLDQQFKTDTAGNDVDVVTSSLPALNFYEGFLLALDTTKEKKFSIQYDVYDTERDSLSLWRLLNSKNISGSDVVMAMLSNSWNNIAAGIASARQYNLFLLQGNSSGCLNGSSKTFLTTASNNTQCKLMAAHLYSSNPNSNVVIVYRDNNKRETDLTDLFYSELDSLTDHASLKKVNYTQGGFNDLKAKLSLSKKNLLIIPSSDESYISSLLSKLADLKEYNFVIAGLPTWEHFESIDPEQLETFNTHIFNTNFIDYTNRAVKDFRKKFIATYHSDPLYPAFQAYDLMQWLQLNLPENKKELDKFETPASLHFTTSGIIPEKLCSDCGYENLALPILKYKDGMLEKVNR